MKDYIFLLAIIGIVVVWSIISWVIQTVSNSKKYLNLQPQLDNLERSRAEHQSKVEKDREEWKFKDTVPFWAPGYMERSGKTASFFNVWEIDVFPLR